MSGPKNALAAWGVAALHAVELPSGMKALIRLPDVAKLIETESMPTDLRDVAAQFATSGIALDDLDYEGRIRVIRLTYELAAHMVRYLALGTSEAWERFKEVGGSPSDEGWEPVTLTGGQLREMDIDQADLTALSKIATRQATPNTVTIGSRLDRGMLEAANAIKPEAAEGRAQPTIAEFQGSRVEPGRDAGSDDGADVRTDAVGLSRGRRSRRAVRG